MHAHQRFALAFAFGLASSATQAASGQIGFFTSTPNPSALNQPVTLESDINYQAGEEPRPTGTMTYFDGGAAIAGCQDIPVQPSGASSVCHTSFSTAGDHSLTVSYSGDANYAATSAGPIDQVVDSGTQYYPILSAAPAFLNGQNGIDLLIQVQGQMPTGTATFMDGILTRCASVPVQPVDANYAHAFCPSDYSFGDHNLTVSYSGDSFYRAGTIHTVRSFGTDKLMDFDRDFQEDQAVLADDGTLSAWLMDGLTVKSKVAEIGNARRGAVHTADFNGDNYTDFLVELPDGSTWMWTNNNTALTGFFLRPQGSGWHATHTGDFNGDGKADIAWRNDNGAAELWLMDGGTTLATAQLVPAGSPWQLQQVADFNGDLRTDLLWRNTMDGSVGVWLMDGATVLERKTILPAGAPWIPSEVADLDSDGMADILWTNVNDGSVGAWLMNGTTQVAHRTLMPANTGWTLSRVASFLDGHMNYLLWTHTSGAVGEWSMHGLDVAAHTTLMPPGTGWHLTAVSHPFGAATVTWTHDSGMVGMWRVRDMTVQQRQTMLLPGSGQSVVSGEAQTATAP
ncbi:MAG TPA: FG-GAP-like repeat-containing protein [Usitatibacter sp.]|jgi:hypothetical protein|nr:FG-GAP-like repeat-containing protein [Usitatibacter sp.]